MDEVLEAAQADYFWAPDDVQVVERPELVYSYSDRDLVFFNSVVKARPHERDPAELVAEVAKRHRGKSSRWSLNVLSDTEPMREALRAGGYVSGNKYHAYAMAPDAYTRAPRAEFRVEQVSTLEQLRELYDVRCAVFGAEGRAKEEDLPRELSQCTGPDARVARFVGYLGETAVASGGMTYFDDLDVAFIWAGGVREEFRGRGAYTGLLRARCDAAAARGITAIGLYANDETSGPIVAAHGFTQYGPMTHWMRSG